MAAAKDDRAKEGAPRKGCPPGEIADLPPHLRERLLRLVPLLARTGWGCVHSSERPDDGGRDAKIDCGDRTALCRAVCCSYRFALTPAEVGKRRLRWDAGQPYFIERGEDGYCAHFDREGRRCGVWEHRPLRCRRFDCLREGSIWEKGRPLRLRPGVFEHLP